MATRRPAFTMLELVISLAAGGVLLCILLPAMVSARVSSQRELCSGNQRLIGQAWEAYLKSHDGRFPTIYVQPAWRYAGVRYSSVDGTAFLDYDRPLNNYLPAYRSQVNPEQLFECPADRGITDERGEAGTGRRTALEAFGTSFRANTRLLLPRGDRPQPPLDRAQITTAPSRLVVMGDPVWFETLESTGRLAAWHGTPNTGNLLFLDGSVRFVTIKPRPAVGPAVFDPLSLELTFPLKKGR